MRARCHIGRYKLAARLLDQRPDGFGAIYRLVHDPLYAGVGFDACGVKNSVPSEEHRECC